MADQQALEPIELVSRLSEGAMALATAGIAAEGMDEQRRMAYERSCGLAEKALEAAASLASSTETVEALGELTAITSRLAERLERLEQQHQQEAAADG